MKTRQEMLEEAFDECIKEMYLNADPPVDIKELIDSGFKDDEKNPLRSKHLIDADIQEDILESTMYVYGIRDDFHNHLDLIKQDLLKGPNIRKSKYEYEQLEPLEEVIGKDNCGIVMDYLKTISEYYRRDHEASSFKFSVLFGPSPDIKQNEGDKN